MIPDIWQLAGIFLAGAFFGFAFVVGRQHMRNAAMENVAGSARKETRKRLGIPGRTAFCMGIILAGILLGWRVWVEGNMGLRGLPLTNYFDCFLLLGLLLAGLGIYFRLTEHLRPLAFFMLPVMAIVFALGGILSLLYRQSFDDDSMLNVAHVASVMAGSFCFAAGAAGGFVYLMADRQLRQRGAPHHKWMRLPSLGALERFNQHAVLIGFPLLTVAMVTGMLRARQIPAATGPWFASPKVLLAVAAWLVYAALLYVPLAPSFRGRRAAWLSIVGVVLLFSVFFAVRWMGRA